MILFVISPCKCDWCISLISCCIGELKQAHFARGTPSNYINGYRPFGHVCTFKHHSTYYLSKEGQIFKPQSDILKIIELPAQVSTIKYCNSLRMLYAVHACILWCSILYYVILFPPVYMHLLLKHATTFPMQDSTSIANTWVRVT